MPLERNKVKIRNYFGEKGIGKRSKKKKAKLGDSPPSNMDFKLILTGETSKLDDNFFQ